MNNTLATAMRPTCLDEIVGQDQITAPGSFLRKCLEKNKLFSLIFYGPPGSGKTTLALVLAETLKIRHYSINATSSGKKDLEQIFAEAQMWGKAVVIIDEVHRLNKDKQDILLPHVESGLITLIGATTANPFIAINPALRSRCHLIELAPIGKEAIATRLRAALTSPKGLDGKYQVDEEAIDYLAATAGGDVRFALNNLEVCVIASENGVVSAELVKETLKVPSFITDKNESGHYDALSAFQKSIRGSDVDAALYYLARLVVSGDYENLFRRLLILAYEDVGLGNPAACARTLSAIESARQVGMPEMVLPLAVAVVDLALSPKSRSAHDGINSALDVVAKGDLPLPRFLRMVTSDDEDEKFPWDRPDLWDKLSYLPKELAGVSFYQGVASGQYENALIQNLLRLRKTPRTQDVRKARKAK